jgi:hypothetical protein
MIWIEDVKEQKDGRFTITYKENGKIIRQANAAFCCHGEKHIIDQEHFLTVHFEVTKCNIKSEEEN